MGNKFRVKRITLLICMILVIMVMVTSSTYAYLFYTGSDNSITGNMGEVDLELDVTRVLPVNETVNSILLFQFNELAGNLNNGCIDQDGEFSLCQLYKIRIKNNTGGVNTRINGSLAFSNETMPNLSWILLGNDYSSSTTYTTSMLDSDFNTASSSYNSFVDNYLLKNGEEEIFYILIWVNEIDRVQYDRGTYTGVVRFQDYNGNGVTAFFGDVESNQ